MVAGGDGSGGYGGGGGGGGGDGVARGDNRGGGNNPSKNPRLAEYQKPKAERPYSICTLGAFA